MQLQNKRYEKVLFVLTSHERDTGEKQGFGQKNLLFHELADKGVIIDIATQKEVNHQLIQK
jgi:hypothetical protein